MEPEKKRRVEEVEVVLKDLLKVIKVVSMYPENNPLPQSLRQTFSDQLEILVEEHGDIKVQVFKQYLVYDEEVVFNDRSKEEALAGLFFDTGITSLTFKSGLESVEILKLLDIIKVYLNSQGKKLDLAQLIWEAGLGRFTFTTVEDVALSEYDGDFNVQEIATPGDGSGRGMDGESREKYESIFSYDDDDSDVKRHQDGNFLNFDDDGSGQIENSHTGARPGGELNDHTVDEKHPMFQAVNSGSNQKTELDVGEIDLVSAQGEDVAQALGFGDSFDQTGGGEQGSSIPDTTLILNDELKLAEEDEEEVRQILAKDAEFNMWESTVELLKEILHQETSLKEFIEAITVCEKILGEFLASGHLIEAGQLLRYFEFLEKQTIKKRPLWSERLREAKTAAGSRERLHIMCTGLNTSSYISAADLRRYLDIFDWQALAGITELIGVIENEVCREAVCDYLSERGKDNVHTVARGIHDKQPEVVRNSIRIISRIGGEKAFAYLMKVVNHSDLQVRLALVEALKDSPDDGVLKILRIAVTDPEVQVRREAVNSIVARRGKPAFDAITEILAGKHFKNMDSDDQQSVLNAYSILGGDQAVDILVKNVKKLNLFGSSNLKYLRSAAFAALAVNKSEKAERLLQKLSGHWRPDIRNQAMDTIQKRREVMYGDDSE